MRIELIMLISMFIEKGYVNSLHVTKDKIYVTIKNDRP